MCSLTLILELVQLFIGRFSYGGQDSAIHIDNLSIYKITGLGGQKYRCTGQILGISPTARRGPLYYEVVEGIAVHSNGCRLVRGKIARAYTVHLDVMGGPFRGQVSSEHFQSTLGRCIGTNTGSAQLTHHGTNIDDFSFLPFDHILGHKLG